MRISERTGNKHTEVDCLFCSFKCHNYFIVGFFVNYVLACLSG